MLLIQLIKKSSLSMQQFLEEHLGPLVASIKKPTGWSNKTATDQATDRE